MSKNIKKLYLKSGVTSIEWSLTEQNLKGELNKSIDVGSTGFSAKMELEKRSKK